MYVDQSWLLKDLRESYTLIDTNIIGKMIENEFPNSCPESNSGIGQVLANLAKDVRAILKKSQILTSMC